MVASARPCPPVPPRNLHGKEGVDGSSPSEGFTKLLQNRLAALIVLLVTGRAAVAGLLAAAQPKEGEQDNREAGGSMRCR